MHTFISAYLNFEIHCENLICTFNSEIVLTRYTYLTFTFTPTQETLRNPISQRTSHLGECCEEGLIGEMKHTIWKSLHNRAVHSRTSRTTFNNNQKDTVLKHTSNASLPKEEVISVIGPSLRKKNKVVCDSVLWACHWNWSKYFRIDTESSFFSQVPTRIFNLKEVQRSPEVSKCQICKLTTSVIFQIIDNNFVDILF